MDVNACVYPPQYYFLLDRKVRDLELPPGHQHELPEGSPKKFRDNEITTA